MRFGGLRLKIKKAKVRKFESKVRRLSFTWKLLYINIWCVKIKNIQWAKSSDDSFDNSMGSLDSAMSSNLVGVYLLYNLIAYDDVNIDNIG